MVVTSHGDEQSLAAQRTVLRADVQHAIVQQRVRRRIVGVELCVSESSA